MESVCASACARARVAQRIQGRRQMGREGEREGKYKDGPTGRGRVTVGAQLSHLTGLSRWSAPVPQVCGTLQLYTAQHSPPFTGVNGSLQGGVTETSFVCQIPGHQRFPKKKKRNPILCLVWIFFFSPRFAFFKKHQRKECPAEIHGDYEAADKKREPTKGKLLPEDVRGRSC